MDRDAVPNDLTAAVNRMHLVAIEALTRRIREERNPQELRKLLTIALRFKDPARTPGRPRPDPISRDAHGAAAASVPTVPGKAVANGIARAPQTDLCAPPAGGAPISPPATGAASPVGGAHSHIHRNPPGDPGIGSITPPSPPATRGAALATTHNPQHALSHGVGTSPAPTPTLTSALGIGAFTAMSDAQFLLLSTETGHTEAHRPETEAQAQAAAEVDSS